ncbi:hypothetical protein [Streptomyces sp. NPDC057382]|uniref:hypothetical protein n=1 Tax=unclassified Streptomyces TaxID=2593676 RepID=UPI0036366DA3
MNKHLLVLLLFTSALVVALTTGIVMDGYLGELPAATLKASGSAFVGTVLVGLGVIKLLTQGGDGPDDPAA